jgi:hypothetical protein
MLAENLRGLALRQRLTDAGMHKVTEFGSQRWRIYCLVFDG